MTHEEFLSHRAFVEDVLVILRETHDKCLLCGYKKFRELECNLSGFKQFIDESVSSPEKICITRHVPMRLIPVLVCYGCGDKIFFRVKVFSRTVYKLDPESEQWKPLKWG